MTKKSNNLRNAEQIAEYLNVKPVTIYSWAKAGKIPHVILSRGKRKDCIRFSQETIEAWIKKRTKGDKSWTKWDMR
jgi:excisionase family DNA binding protein